MEHFDYCVEISLVFLLIYESFIYDSKETELHRNQRLLFSCRCSYWRIHKVKVQEKEQYENGNN